MRKTKQLGNQVSIQNMSPNLFLKRTAYLFKAAKPNIIYSSSFPRLKQHLATNNKR
jgi:hypothetical protein